MILFSIGSVAAASTVDVSITDNNVAINGNIGIETSTEVAVKVINPAGGYDYIGQMTSEIDGSYSFSYQISNAMEGEYIVQVGGNGIQDIPQESFLYETGGDDPVDEPSFDIELINNLVTITGGTSAGSGKQVTAKVVNPAGGVDYLGQTTSGTDGDYTFSYSISSGIEGEYDVYIGGNGIKQIQQEIFKFAIPDTEPPTIELLMNGNQITEEEAVAIEDHTTVSFDLHSEDMDSGVASESIMVDGEPYVEGELIDWAGELGSHQVEVMVADHAGNITALSFTIEVTTSVNTIELLVERYSATGELGGPLQTQLEQKLKQAEHHMNNDRTKQAAKFMEDFMKHLHNEALQEHVTENVKNILNADASYLFAQWDS